MNFKLKAYKNVKKKSHGSWEGSKLGGNKHTQTGATIKKRATGAEGRRSVPQCWSRVKKSQRTKKNFLRNLTVFSEGTKGQVGVSKTAKPTDDPEGGNGKTKKKAQRESQPRTSD